ncbi:MAG: Clp1/GlmU family protein [Candidatus Methanomethylicia archaeon]|nr:Clp1/GlmU family protein [Candidatus Methanomethylicia archaeon]
MSSNIGFRELDLTNNQVLWISGPARINVVEGLAEVFGAKIKAGGLIIVKRFKSIYVKALGNCKIRISPSAYFKYVESDGIPIEWHNLMSEIINFKGKIMVIGGIDSGKNTLVTFLSNQLLDLGFRVGVLDTDVGQNELGPPTTMTLGLVHNPIVSLDQLKLIDCVFIGSTSPAYACNEILIGLKKLIDSVNKLDLDYLLINTTGWISNGGVKFKIEKINLIKPNIIIGIQRENELEPIFQSISNNFKVYRIPPSQMVRARDRYDRKMIRQMNYSKWFSDATNKKINIHDVTIFEPNIFNGVYVDSENLCYLSKIVNVDLATSIINRDKLLIFPYKDVEIDESLKIKIASEFKVNKCIFIPISNLISLLIGFQDLSNDRFLGLGIITNLNFNDGWLQVYTNANLSTCNLKIIFGSVRLNPLTFDEIGFFKIKI